MVRKKSNTWFSLDFKCNHRIVYRRLWQRRMGCLLGRRMDLRPLVQCTAWYEYCLEGTVCHCHLCTSWGTLWQRRKIPIHCDNHTVVDVWETDTSKSSEIMALVCLLFSCAAHNNFNIYVQRITYSLSHFQDNCSRRLAPNANLHPDRIPVWPHQAFTDTSYKKQIFWCHPVYQAHISGWP